VTNDCGNSISQLQIISIEDNEPPTINCPFDQTIETGDSEDPSVNGFPIVMDDYDPNPVVVFTDNVILTGTYPIVQIIERTWTATDNCGNPSSCLQIINIIDCSLDNTFTGNGGTSTDWTDANNWSSGCVPTSPVTGTITIAADCSSTGSGTMIFDGVFKVNSTVTLTVDPSESWTLNQTTENFGILSGTINGDLWNHSGATFSGSVTGNCINDGTLSPGN